MLTLYGRDDVLRNLYRLAKLESPEAIIETSEQLRPSYLAFLAAHQPWVPINWTEDVFVTAPEVEDRLSAAFSEGALDDLSQADVFGPAYPHDVRLAKLDLARRALADLLVRDGDFALVFGLVIHSVFIRSSKPARGMRGSHGGSSSASIGAIWLTVNDGVGMIDLMEMYVHELTHHLIFVDELNHGQFDYDAIAKPENFAHSAILKRHRPLDKVVHSIIVATEIMAARARYLDLDHESGSTIHPPTTALRAETLAAMESVQQLPNLTDLITPHTSKILARCEDAIREYR